MKKVLIFSIAYYPFVGGAEVAIKEITDRIKDVQFDMITARMDKKLIKFERFENVNVYRVGFGLGFLDKFILAVLGFLKAVRLHKKNKPSEITASQFPQSGISQGKYDAVWSIMANQASVAASFFKIFYPKVKLLLTLQEGDEEEHLKRYVLGLDFLYKLLIRPWHLLVFKKADFITTISNYLRQRAIRNKVRCPIEVIPNAVNIKHFSQNYSQEELDELKNKLGKKPDDKFIITTSRLVIKNAIGDVIEALQYLPENVKFLILGTGPFEDDLKFKIKNLKLDNRIIFLGHIDHKELPKYLKISDVFVRPSLSEGMGNSFIEAMAAGVPVIATPIGGIPDFLKDGETGLFCEVRNPENIAQKIKIFLENESLREQIITNARKLVLEKYDWNLIAPQMREIFLKKLYDKSE